MKLLDLMRRESTISWPSVAFVAGLAGLSNALVLGFINAAAEQASKDSHSERLMALFAVAIVVYFVAQKHILVTTTAEIEGILHRVRVRLADKIRSSDLLLLEQIGRSRIYASVTKESLTISQAAPGIVIGCQFAVLLFFAVLYLAWLSVPAFVLSVIFISIALSVYFKRNREFNTSLHEAMNRDNRLFESLTDMLEGFKEIKINAARSADQFEHLQELSQEATSLRIKTQQQLALQFIFSQMTFYLLLATMVFVVPRLSEDYSDVVIKVTTAILFMIGPISGVVGLIPTLAMANAASENIFDLEAELDLTANEPGDPNAGLESFHEITFEAVTFAFNDPTASRPFAVGPLDFTLRCGEVLFIKGGNGSGKTTLLRLLTALYYPQSGIIRVDGVPLNESNAAAYRNLFSAIFSEYHLFRRLYGLDHVSDERVNALLAEMDLDQKTRLIDRNFDTLDLSGGQKKRLALLVSMLEDKPIFVFDEWAADQDPEFRRKFYTELLPQLKRSGKTVIAATHDDRYFDTADRLLKMEEGRLAHVPLESEDGN